MNFYEAWTLRGGHYLIVAETFAEAASHFVNTIRLEKTQIEGVVLMGERGESIGNATGILSET